MIIRCDFHMHSCLSPCGSLRMSPNILAQKLSEKGVQLAALTDHNSALNCPTFQKACKKFGIHPLFGIEVQTNEECHVLALFSHLETALEMGERIYELLPEIQNIPEKTGDQVYVDEDDNILGTVEKYLVTSANLDLDSLTNMIHSLGGLVIPAHVNRPSFSLTSQLGCVIDGKWDAIEVSVFPKPMEHLNDVETRGYPCITSSDAHHLSQIASHTFELDIANDTLCDSHGNVNIETVRKALQRLSV